MHQASNGSRTDRVRVRIAPVALDRARRDLAALPVLHDECEPISSRMGGLIAERVSGSRRADLSIDPVALAVRSDVVNLLAAWAELVVHERALAMAPLRTVPGLSAFLARHFEWLAGHPAAEEFVAELRRVTEAAERCARRGPLPIGACVQESCSGTLYPFESGDESAPSVRCDTQGHIWRANQWLLLARRLNEPDRGPVEPLVPAGTTSHGLSA